MYNHLLEITMSHFRLIRSEEIYESQMHEDVGSPIGDEQIYLCSATASAALDKSRPKGTSFTANNWHCRKWFDKFLHHADHNCPEYVYFAKGVRSGRWFAKAVSF
jgi:hypothetical protein